MAPRLPLASMEGSLITPQQMIFALEYVKDFDAGRAASAAGYKDGERSGALLLDKPDVLAEIDLALGRRIKRLQADGDTIYLETLAAARAARAAGKYEAAKGLYQLLGQNHGLWNQGRSRQDAPPPMAFQFNFGRDALPQGVEHSTEGVIIHAGSGTGTQDSGFGGSEGGALDMADAKELEPSAESVS